MARTYRALAALLSYPTAELQAASGEIADILVSEGVVPPPRDLLSALAAEDLYDLQACYVDLFDRGRATSLYLFEHVHGESRDRGQAMADLIDLYRRNGLETTAEELPDFLPLFLEFLSTRPEAEARSLLAEPAAILRALADRLARRAPRYAALLDSLAALANAPAEVAPALPADDPDDLASLDAAWEEQEVRFGPGEAFEGCSTDRLRTRLRAATRSAPAEETTP